MDGKDLNEMASQLKNQLDGIQRAFNNNFNSMPPDVQQKVKGPHLDLNKAIKAAKSGDVEALYKLSK